MPIDLVDGVSFKRVFSFVSVMFAALGAAGMLYVGMAETGTAHEDLPVARFVVPYSAPVLPEPVVTIMAPPVPVVLLPEPIVPQWPIALTYRDAKNNASYYREWLTTMNPKVRYRAVRAIVTAYCPCSICCGSGAHGVTRTGVHTDIEPYGVAGPDSFLRKRVHIPGYMFESEPGKFWRTDDTGSALNEDWNDSRTYHFDVRFTSHDWAKRHWGRRLMTVYVAE